MDKRDGIPDLNDDDPEHLDERTAEVDLRAPIDFVATLRGNAPLPATSHPVLIVAAGAGVGRILPLGRQDRATIGRGSDCHFCLDDARASRLHARFTKVASGYLFEDAGSTNGSYVNSARVKDAQFLRAGDRIQIGETLLRFAYLYEREQEALNTVHEAATRDVLTGLLNRRALTERLDAEIAFASRHHAELAVAMVDIDRFKEVNDDLGHEAGDLVLQAIGRLFKTTVRTEDVAARWGGEEFLVVLRGSDLTGGRLMAERLRKTVAAHPFAYEGKAIPVTVSCGVATAACCGERLERASLLRIADERLYRAKTQGRNRVVTA